MWFVSWVLSLTSFRKTGKYNFYIFLSIKNILLFNLHSSVFYLAHGLSGTCSGHFTRSRGSGRQAQGLDEVSCSTALQEALHIYYESVGVCVARCISARDLVLQCLHIHAFNDQCGRRIAFSLHTAFNSLQHRPAFSTSAQVCVYSVWLKILSNVWDVLSKFWIIVQ